MSNLKPPVYRGAEGGRRAAEANPETSRGGEAGLKIRRENPVAEPGRRRSEPPPGRPWRRICCASACGALEDAKPFLGGGRRNEPRPQRAAPRGAGLRRLGGDGPGPTRIPPAVQPTRAGPAAQLSVPAAGSSEAACPGGCCMTIIQGSVQEMGGGTPEQRPIRLPGLRFPLPPELVDSGDGRAAGGVSSPARQLPDPSFRWRAESRRALSGSDPRR